WMTTQRIAQKFPLRFGVALSLALSGGIGFMAIAYMVSLPPTLLCTRWLLPITSASMRFYCAQAAAETRTTAGTVTAIAFLRGLPSSHRRFPESRQKVEDLAMDLLTLAEQSFDLGQLEEAIDTLENIPRNSAAYPLIQDRLSHWQARWQKESANYSDMDSQLRQSRWNSALMRASGNLNITGFVENKYGKP
ncbi:MAG: chromosome segregation ATPase, partial [Synechocystis sp.]|nr:chromosome segregation ATPase [Synechocystis sp.]